MAQREVRTTVTLRKHLAEALVSLQEERDSSFKDIVNEAIEHGVKAMRSPKARKRFRTRIHDAGGLVDPSKSARDILNEMDEEYFRKKLSAPD